MAQAADGRKGRKPRLTNEPAGLDRDNLLRAYRDMLLIRRFEDVPFYTRSEFTTTLYGREAHGVHESLDLDRFAARWVQTLLPFRMPRIAKR